MNFWISLEVGRIDRTELLFLTNKGDETLHWEPRVLSGSCTATVKDTGSNWNGEVSSRMQTRADLKATQVYAEAGLVS